MITSANALSQCVAGTQVTVFRGVTDLGDTSDGFQSSFTCGPDDVTIRSEFVVGEYHDDLAVVDLDSGFEVPDTLDFITLRTATSSPIQSFNDDLYAIGYGESSPGAAGSPLLTYAPINSMTNHVCFKRFNGLGLGLEGKFSFKDNFCVSGQVDDPRTGVTTDACVLDAGGVIFRTQDILNPQSSFEVVGTINFATCSAATPIIVSYLFKFDDILPIQVNLPNPLLADPANPDAAFGNFACGDGRIQGNGLEYEQCDPGQNPDPTNLDNNCCNPWTCKFLVGGTECSSVNNGTFCRSQPRCNSVGRCYASPRLTNKRNCNGTNTVCKQGRCCIRPNPNKADPLSCFD
jgi:hypothetical protein